LVDRYTAVKRKAQQLVQKGDVDGAIAEFEKLFASGDKDPYDFILVADLLAKRGSMQEAVRRYRQAIDEYTTAELFKNAIAVCKKILRISKEDLQIHRSLGDLYSKEGLYGDAQIHYLEFAEGSIRRQDYDAALDVVDQVLKLSPDNAELSEKYVEIALRGDMPERGGRELLRRADRATLQGRVEEAAALKDRASTLAPSLQSESAEPEPEDAAPAGPALEAERPPEPPRAAAPPVADPLNLGFEPSARHSLKEPDSGPARPDSPAVTPEDLAREYVESGNRDQAAEELWNAAAASYANGDATRARARLEQLLEIAPAHEPALRRLVEITEQAEDRPAESRARFELAEVYLAHEDWDLARAEYMRCLELDPGNDRARVRVQRLDSLADGAAPAPAAVDLDALPSARPSASVRIRDESPVDAANLVDLEEIIDEFKAGVSERISGEDHESHYDLGMAYMEMGLYDEAIGEFQVASKGSPMELKCLEMIALCFLEKNEPASAARELGRALELPGYGPEDTISIRYNLGVANERLGNIDRALQHFEEVYLLNVDFLKVASKVKELKQKLARAQDRG
jgi:tetratricopeptide (TPR) repeat protein